MKNFHRSSKFDAKHWSIFLAWLRTICVSESVNFIEKLDQRYNPRRLNLVHNDKFVIVEYYIFNSHWKRKVFISSFLSPHKRFAKTKENVWYVLENQYIQDVLVRYRYTYTNGKCYLINIKFNVRKAESPQLIQKYKTIKNSIFLLHELKYS